MKAKHLTILLITILSYGCEKPIDNNEDTSLKIPKVLTKEVNGIATKSALSGGEITDDFGYTVTTRGVCWGTNETPTINDFKTVDGSGGGSFISSILNLTPNTKYYIRAYASNIKGTGYGMTLSFTTLDGIVSLSTLPISEITSNSAKSGGNIISDGGSEVISRGVVWSKETNPTLDNNNGYTNEGTGIGSFTSNLNSLTGGTKYFIRAYAKNDISIYFGNDVEFTTITSSVGDGVSDFEGNHYSSIIINGVEWMAENLKSTKYNDGSQIYYPNYSWGSNNTGAYTWYDNNSSSKYGALYNWYAVSSDKLCPTGWKVPSDEDWSGLISFISSLNTNDIGTQLKSCRQIGSPLGGVCLTSNHPRWNSHSVYYGTDDFGFSGLPGGTRYFTGPFYSLGYIGYWWTSSQRDGTFAWSYNMKSESGDVSREFFNKGNGFSVRCIKKD